MILHANDLSNAEDETSFLQAELGLMQSRFHRAQTKVKLLTDAIQYLTESYTGKCVHCSQLQLILTYIYSIVQGGAQPRRRLFVDQYKCQLDNSSNTGESYRTDF